MQKNLTVFFALKVRLKERKFEFC